MNHTAKEHYVHVLSRMLGTDETQLIHQLLNTGKIFSVNTGDTIFHEGDTHSSLYIVLSGRCRATVEKVDGTHILGDIAEGEPFGEYALFTREPRSATVFAIRPSELLEITEEVYLDLVSFQPGFASKLTGILVDRLNRNNLQKHLESPPKNMAVLKLQDDLDIEPWTDLIQAEFDQKGYTFQVYDHDHWKASENITFFRSMEEQEGLHVMFCSANQPEWSRQCIVYADLVIVVSDFYADKNLYPIESQLALYENNLLNKKINLLLLHPENGPQPKHTGHWLQNRHVALHIHFRKNNTRDCARFCRIITNQAIGLVLGGGGAKGYAHIGAVKALLEAGVPIDFLGGTSAGALYGLGMAMCDFDIEKIDYYTAYAAKSRLTSNDYTFPVVSMMSGKKMTQYIQFMLGEYLLEDFWINVFCVSTNFSSAQLSIHERGTAWKRVQASIAIPGVYPPVVLDGELHVDGGVMDNIPIEPMYRYPVSHVIAIALTGLRSYQVGYKETPSPWDIFWDKLFRHNRYKIPTLASLIINSLTLNSTQKQEQNKSGVSLYIELNLKGVSMMDDSKWKSILDKGYEQTAAFLEQVSQKDKFWKSETKI